MTGPLPQSDSRHGNQDQDQQCSQSPSGRMEPFHQVLGRVLSSALNNGHPGGSLACLPRRGSRAAWALLCALLLLHHLQEEDGRIPPQQLSPSRWGMPARGPRTIKTKRKTEKTQQNMALLRQLRVPSRVLPAGSHRTGGKGKYEWSGGEGLTLPVSATPSPLGWH